MTKLTKSFVPNYDFMQIVNKITKIDIFSQPSQLFRASEQIRFAGVNQSIQCRIEIDGMHKSE